MSFRKQTRCHRWEARRWATPRNANSKTHPKASPHFTMSQVHEVSFEHLLIFFSRKLDGQNEVLMMELLPLGSLETMLTRMRFFPSQKWTICHQICSAMKVLSFHHILHRDLAIRNVLIQSLDPIHVKVHSFCNTKATFFCQIADFGLAKRIGFGLDLEENENERLPLAWLAPEVIKRRTWSEKSDVWAFGVTMWEIFSNGKEPFHECPSEIQIMEHITQGRILSKPQNCPEEAYQVMKNCWQYVKTNVSAPQSLPLGWIQWNVQRFKNSKNCFVDFERFWKLQKRF